MWDKFTIKAKCISDLSKMNNTIPNCWQMAKKSDNSCYTPVKTDKKLYFKTQNNAKWICIENLSSKKYMITISREEKKKHQLIF